MGKRRDINLLGLIKTMMVSSGKLIPKIKARLNSINEKVAGAETAENETKLSANDIKLKRMYKNICLQERLMINLNTISSGC
jgi:hypothetical protein